MNRVSRLRNRISVHTGFFLKSVYSFFRKAGDLFVIKRVITEITKSEVLIGFISSHMGGVPHHLHSIDKYSSLKTGILLPYGLESRYNTKGFREKFERGVVKAMRLRENRVIHSHVDPWFIDVCNEVHGEEVKWFHTYHTLYFDKDWDKGLAPWQEEINRSLTEVACNADVRISISYWLKELLMTEYGIDTVYVPNGVDVEKCDAADPERFVSIYKMRDFILFASGLSDIKNAIDFLRLVNAMPDQQFVIIGREISREALAAKFDINIPDNLAVIGQMSHEDLLDAIAACKVFVVTSRSEGLPTVLMEAMALKRTVVGCDTYGTKEVIGSEEFGYIYKHESIDDLVKKTRAALITPKGESARERVLKEYDWRVVMNMLDTLYKDYM